MCKYSDDTDYECPHESLKDSDYCIFHLHDRGKDIDEFNKRIDEEFDTEKDWIDLHGFYFPPESSDFSAHIFQKNIDFSYAIFSGQAEFRKAEFCEAVFFRTEFSGRANFFNAKFKRKVSFLDTIFSGDAGFQSTEFCEADFYIAKFKRKANFKDAIFSEYAGFKSAEFLDARFSGAQFLDARFFGAQFSRRANFVDTKFSGEVDFRKAEFSGHAGFWMTKFRNADFSSATFSGKTIFKDAIFSGDTSFIITIFSGKTNFEDTTFSGDVNFKYAELTGKFVFIPIKSETIIFKDTYFSDNVRIKADMSKCSFANSNVERIDMTDSIWIVNDKPKNSYSALIEWFKNKIGISETSIIIWEERQGELSSNWSELESIYRRLKQSSQKFGDNDTAGKFYYQEMECKRKQLKGFKNLFWNVFYKKLCGYGEKPFNVIWFSGLIIFASSLLFLYNGIELLGSVGLDIPPRLIDYKLSFNFQWITNFDKVFRDWLECLYTSVITFTTLGYGDVHPIGWSRVVASVEAGFGIIMTALFIFVFTRKMLR